MTDLNAVKTEMLDFAAAAASDLGSSERNATKFGAKMLSLVWEHGQDMDQLREDTMARVKRWTASAETGGEIKKKFTGWFSRLSKVNGCKGKLTEDERKRLLAGEMSFQSVYNSLRKREKEEEERAQEQARQEQLAQEQAQEQAQAQPAAPKEDVVVAMARELALFIDEHPLHTVSEERFKALDDLFDALTEARNALAAHMERKAA